MGALSIRIILGECYISITHNIIWVWSKKMLNKCQLNCSINYPESTRKLGFWKQIRHLWIHLELHCIQEFFDADLNIIYIWSFFSIILYSSEYLFRILLFFYYANEIFFTSGELDSSNCVPEDSSLSEELMTGREAIKHNRHLTLIWIFQIRCMLFLYLTIRISEINKASVPIQPRK